jgi:hypothetical protein
MTNDLAERVNALGIDVRIMSQPFGTCTIREYDLSGVSGRDKEKIIKALVCSKDNIVRKTTEGVGILNKNGEFMFGYVDSCYEGVSNGYRVNLQRFLIEPPLISVQDYDNLQAILEITPNP